MARKKYLSDENRPHRRRAFCRIPTSILREPWTRDQKLALVLLQLHMVDEWARDGKTWAEASTTVLSPGVLAEISGRSHRGYGQKFMRTLQELVGISVRLRGEYTEISWPKFAEFQALPGRDWAESGRSRGQSAPAPADADATTPTTTVANAPEGGGSSKKKTRKTPKASPEVIRVTDLWIDRLESEQARPPPTNRASWYDEMRKMIDLDGAKLGELEKVVLFLTSTDNTDAEYPFVCLSPSNLRRNKCDKYDRIRGRMNGKPAAKVDPGAASNERLRQRMAKQQRRENQKKADELF